jgi:murein DD-endopeptidase MepM/ murein hydrolase activator NlpD
VTYLATITRSTINLRTISLWMSLALLASAPVLMAQEATSTTTEAVATEHSPTPSSAAFPGGIYVWAIPPAASRVTYRDKPVLVVNDHALVGIPIMTTPGEYHLDYSMRGTEKRHAFTVQDKQYTEQHITIKNQNLVDPPAETLARISAEAQRQRKLYGAFEPDHRVAEGFQLPLEGIVTSLYGHRRFFNGKPRSPHTGLDIAADHGTEIRAAGAGKVTLAEDLYFNGNTLFLDHGQGLITMYCHMSEHLVREGDIVEKGQVIGRVGATGRATGPHLHWSVSLNGTRVDPQTFMTALNQTAKE